MIWIKHKGTHVLKLSTLTLGWRSDRFCPFCPFFFILHFGPFSVCSLFAHEGMYSVCYPVRSIVKCMYATPLYERNIVIIKITQVCMNICLLWGILSGFFFCKGNENIKLKWDYISTVHFLFENVEQIRVERFASKVILSKHFDSLLWIQKCSYLSVKWRNLTWDNNVAEKAFVQGSVSKTFRGGVIISHTQIMMCQNSHCRFWQLPW